MKWLIYLYPKKWRERYGEEFLYILENKKLSFKEAIDVFINAMDARYLNIVERMMQMDNKIRDVMIGSVLNRFLIIGSVIFIGLLGGYLLGKSTPSILNISPQSLLLIGVGLGLFIGYVVCVVRGILRVIHVVRKEEEVLLPTGKLKFDQSDR